MFRICKLDVLLILLEPVIIGSLYVIEISIAKINQRRPFIFVLRPPEKISMDIIM